MLRQFIKDESGNLSIIAGVSFAALLIAVTVSYEIMQVNAVKSDLQATLDDATFYVASNPEERTSIDKGVFQLKSNYGIRHPEHDPTVEFTSQGEDLIGTANITVPVTFSRILSVDSLDVNVRSVVKKIEKEISPPCITALSTTAPRHRL
jgi:Flp pilus assembly protein TadG